MPSVRLLAALTTLLAASASAQVISSDVTWSGTVNLDRDVRINPGVTVTVSPGTQIIAATSDLANLGSATTRIEIIVQGTLTVNGTAGSNVTFTSAGSSQGSWTGLRVEAGGTATLTNAVIDEASIAVANSGTVTMTGGIVRNNATGLQSNAGSLGATRVLVVSNGNGLWAQGGGLTVDHATIYGNSYGVYSTGTSGSVSVTSSIVTNNTSYGFYRSSGAVAITTSYNDVWQNSTDSYNTSAGTGTISANPLYVTPGTNFRLTSNSPARFSDGSNLDMGAFAYTSDATPSLTGTLWASTTLSGANAVTGDLTVAPGVTLTLSQGATLMAASSDLMQSGDNVNRVELIVRGTLTGTGTAAMPITLTATNTSQGSWVGVRVEAGGTANLAGVVVERATYGFDVSGSLQLSLGTVRNNSNGIRTNAGSATVGTTLFTNNGNGLWAQGGTVSIDHATSYGNSYGFYSTGTSGSVTVTGSIVTGNSSYGFYRSSGAVAITTSYNDVWQNSSDYYNTSAGTGTISSNPLFVSAGSNFRLTSNSPARKSDAAMGDLGAFPYVSDVTSQLTGTLWTNTTLSTNTITGDLIIPAGVTVTLPAGATLTAAASDLMQAGDNVNRIEIIVRGTLTITGTPSMPSTLTATNTAQGSWVGVRVEAGGSVTASSLVVERATYGFDSSGTFTLSAGTLRNNSSGVRTNAGSANVTGTLFTNNGNGLWAQGGTVLIDHATSYANSYGFYSTGSSGSVTVKNSVVTGNSSYGFYRSSGAVAITASYNDVWQNNSDYYNTSAGTGTLSSNPLFVSAGSNFRLTSNSPARFSDDTGTDMGAFPYVNDATPSLTGTLWVNTNLSGSNVMTGDVTVAPGVTLTLAAGATLTAPAADLMQAGDNVNRTELIVRGRLTANGTSGSPVTLTATNTAQGSWVGVRVESGATATLANTLVERATYGVDVTGTLQLTSGTVRNNSSGIRTNAGSTTVSTTLFTNNGNGLWAQGGTVTVDHATSYANSYGFYSTGSSGSVTVTASIVTGNSSYGFYRSSGAVAITTSYNDVWQNSSDSYNTSAGTGTISSNPLFVSPGSNFRLTSNSPARRSDGSGNDMGAFPYGSDATPGLHGTLWVDTLISTSTTLAGDLTVGPGVTLTLEPGVTLTAAASDVMQAGDNVNRVELIVRGTLTANATAGNPVVLTATNTSQGSWVGVRVESGGAASLTGVTITRATYGIDANASVTMNDAVLTNNSSGVRTNAGTVSVNRTLFQSNGNGLWAQGGTVSVDHATSYANSYGFYSTGSSGSVTVTNSVVTGNSSYGFYRSSGAVAITTSYNDVWQNSSDYYNTSAGTGTISANPLYVSAGSNLRLTSNSPARKSDSTLGDMGAFPYVSDPTPGLVGTLWTNTAISTSAALLGDLTVAPGVTLTLGAGVTLTAPAADLMQAGDNVNRTELIVLGTLQSSGTSASPVVLTATNTAQGSWVGVRVPSGGSATLGNTTVTRGTYCLDVFGQATVSNARFTNCSTGVRTNAGATTVAFTLFDANGNGLWSQGGTLQIDHATLYGNSYALYSTGTSGSLSVINSIFSTNSSYGIYRSSGALAATNSYNLFFSSTNYNTTTGSNTLTVDPQLVAPGSGDFRLTAGSPARSAGTSASDLGAFPFAPGAVDRVVIAPTTATVAAGGMITFTATAFDASNNPVPTATFSWSALGSAGVINSSGVLTASCTPGSVTNGVTVTSNGRSASANVTITTAPIASLVVSPATATVRSQQTQQFSVMALDACNNPVAMPTVTWTAVGSVGVVSSTGLYTAGCSRGNYPNAIVATAGSVSGRATVTVDPGLLSSVALTPTSATLPINGTRQFTGSAVDGCGNPLSTMVSYATTVTGGTVNGSGLFTAGTTPGTFTNGVTASATEASVTRTASANVTVTGGAVASVMVMPATATLSAGGTVNFMAVALDSAGNMVAGTPSWSVVSGGGSITQAGVFTAGTTAGTFTNTVRATIDGVNGTASVIVQPGAVTRVAVSPMTVTLAPMGSTTFTAQAFDANNNMVTAPVTWSASSAAGTITQGGVFTAGTMSGNYPASVTATVGSVSGTASVTINSGALSQLTLTPSVASTQAGGTLAFTATGRDGNGNTVAVTPTWSVVSGGGTIAQTGVFTAGTTTGTFANTVRAESNGVTAFATVSVTPGPLVMIDLTPTSATLKPGFTQQFTAAGRDAFGNPVVASVTWSTNMNAGSITAGGLFTAGMLPGDYADGVRATAGAVMATASVRVEQEVVVVDAGMDAGMMEVDAGVDAGTMMGTDAGTMSGSDAGTLMQPDAGNGGNIGGTTSCTCAQVDALAPFFGLLVLALRRRRS